MFRPIAYNVCIFIRKKYTKRWKQIQSYITIFQVVDCWDEIRDHYFSIITKKEDHAIQVIYTNLYPN